MESIDVLAQIILFFILLFILYVVIVLPIKLILYIIFGGGKLYRKYVKSLKRGDVLRLGEIERTRFSYSLKNGNLVVNGISRRATKKIEGRLLERIVNDKQIPFMILNEKKYSLISFMLSKGLSPLLISEKGEVLLLEILKKQDDFLIKDCGESIRMDTLSRVKGKDGFSLFSILARLKKYEYVESLLKSQKNLVDFILYLLETGEMSFFSEVIERSYLDNDGVGKILKDLIKTGDKEKFDSLLHREKFRVYNREELILGFISENLILADFFENKKNTVKNSRREIVLEKKENKNSLEIQTIEENISLKEEAPTTDTHLSSGVNSIESVSEVMEVTIPVNEPIEVIEGKDEQVFFKEREIVLDSGKEINLTGEETKENIIIRQKVELDFMDKIYYDRGKDYIKRGYFDYGLDAFKEVVKRRPGYLETYEEIKEIHSKIGGDNTKKIEDIIKLIPSENLKIKVMDILAQEGR